MEFSTYGWMDFDKVVVNDEALAAYYANTKTKWKTKVQGHPSFNHNLILINGLARSDKVRYLELKISEILNPAQQTELLDLLCENLLRNNSLSHLFICYPYYRDQPLNTEALVRVINTLIVRNIKLEGFGIRGGTFSPDDSAVLIDQINELLVAYHRIKELVLDFTLDQTTQRTLLSTLQHNCKELNVLQIGEYSDAPDDLVIEWINYIASVPMRKVRMTLGNLENEPSIVKEMLNEHASLEFFTERRCVELDCTRRNREQRIQRQEGFIAANSISNISDCWHDNDGGWNYLADMPKEMIQAILNLTDLPTILKFRTTSSRFCKLIKSSSFWRTFYCSQARCVPSEVLEISDMTYGAYLYDNQSNDEPITFWEYITRAWYWTSASVKHKYNKQPYLKSHRDFIDELYRSYPEVATILRYSLSIGPNYRVGTKKASKWIDEPYTVINFNLYVCDFVIYHVIFELVGENSISGIFFWKSYDEGSSMEYISHIFDWFHATSVEEAIGRARSMVKDLIAANTAESAVNLTISLLKPRGFIEFEWNRVVTIQQQCLTEVAVSIDNQCTALLQSLNVKPNDALKFTTLVQRFSDKFQNVDVTVPDYQLLRSIVERAQGNAKYVVSGHQWNFTGNMWGTITPNPRPFRLPQSNKQREKTLLGLIHQFTRRLLNLILMPVIKSLWYQDVYADNFVVHTFCKSVYSLRDTPYRPKRWKDRTKKRIHPFQAYLADIWVHPDDVTIQHAVPRAWPLTAATLARRIIPSLCDTVSSLLHYHWDLLQNGTTSRTLVEVDALFDLLRQFDVIPLEHTKRVQDAHFS